VHNNLFPAFLTGRITLAYFLSLSEPEFKIKVNSCGDNAIKPRFKPENKPDKINKQNIINNFKIIIFLFNY
jgi:hypothetical protein